MNRFRTIDEEPVKKSFIQHVMDYEFQSIDMKEVVKVKYFPYLIFVAVLGVVYIANTHYTEKLIKRIDKIESEVEELRVDYTTLTYKYLYVSNRSTVEKKINNIGLIEIDKPVVKIDN